MMMARRARRRKTKVKLVLLHSANNPRRNAIIVEVGDISPNSASTSPKEAILLVAAAVVLLAREEEIKAMVVEAVLEGEAPIPMPTWCATTATKKATLRETVSNSRTNRMGAPTKIMVLLHS
jgi:hypothetical protein